MQRRELRFECLDDLLADVHALPAEGLTASGNWTPAGNVDHVAKLIRASAEGFPTPRGPLPQRLLFTGVAKLLGNRLFGMRLKPGQVKTPRVLDWSMPDEGLAWPDAVERLEQAVASAKAHGMTHPSPLFGKLTPDQWRLLHCRHAELHFGFILPPA